MLGREWQREWSPSPTQMSGRGLKKIPMTNFTKHKNMLSMKYALNSVLLMLGTLMGMGPKAPPRCQRGPEKFQIFNNIFSIKYGSSWTCLCWWLPWGQGLLQNSGQRVQNKKVRAPTMLIISMKNWRYREGNSFLKWWIGRGAAGQMCSFIKISFP